MNNKIIPKFCVIISVIFLFGCRTNLEKEIVLNSKSKDYLVSIKLQQTKKSDYFGYMYFANLSSQTLEFTLTEDIFRDEKYNIYIKSEDKIYPFYNDSLASIIMVLPKNEIKVYKIVLYSMPDNFDWDKAKLVISPKLFK